MANHGFISSRKHFKKKDVTLHLHQINQKRFKGLLKIEEDDDGWSISYNDPTIYKKPVGFGMWIRSPRMLEHRHEFGWAFYLEIVFSHELGTIYNGTLSDECCEEKWKPDPEKYATYKKWLEDRYSHLPKILASSLIEDEMRLVPPPFKDL